jgi:DNA (cytosine-5)-methyltransferase 1
MAHKQQALREMALFAGAGGGILGGKLLGWECVCAVEWEPYAAAVLAARQNEGFLPPFPIWDDVQTFNGKPWRGLVDVVSGGFPCQDISSAGRGAGITGERSGMWKHMARIIGEVRPRYVLVENSPVLTSRGLGVVLGDLAALGYDAEWGVLGAVHAGGDHERERIWILAADSACGALEDGEDVGGGMDKTSEGRKATGFINGTLFGVERCDSECELGRTVHGMAVEMDRLKAIGNGQVPQVMAMAFCILHERLSNNFIRK